MLHYRDVVRDFTYNSRSELLEDRISRGGSFAYCYDNIGNRKIARELEEEVAYESNRLNQYADIAGGKEDFTPVYDADGNQTRIRTSTGIWEVSYDANDRPVVFTSQDGRTSITCGYDYRGRRFEKKGHRQWGSIQPLPVPVPGLSAGSPTGFDASRTLAGEELFVGSDGAYSHARPDDDMLERQHFTAGRASLLHARCLEERYFHF